MMEYVMLKDVNDFGTAHELGKLLQGKKCDKPNSI